MKLQSISIQDLSQNLPSVSDLESSLNFDLLPRDANFDLPSPVLLPHNPEVYDIADPLEKLQKLNESLLAVNVTTWQQRTRNLRSSCDKYYKPFKNQECAYNISRAEQDNNGLGMSCDPEKPMMPDRYNFIMDVERSVLMCLPPK